MMHLDDIFASHESDLKIVEKRIRDLFKSPVFAIPMIGKHILDGGGKRLRPLIMLLSAEMSGYKGDASFTLAGIIESIHTASLLHDDVIDGADVRRGKTPAHAVWGNQIVILVGDYLYSNALRLAVLHKSQGIMESLSEATTRMTEAEILQLLKTADPDITEKDYLEIVSGKTAALISAACRIGAILGSVPTAQEEALSRFGKKMGIAFQMADDILDYMADESELGKRLGKDLKEGKITLPLIYLLKAASRDELKEVKAIIKGSFRVSGLRKILRLFKRYDTIALSLEKAREIISEAKSELRVFPDSNAKEALFTIADYTLLRKK
ncbi:MAG TPA: polyprenyl synthetase family protein [Thermodesulfovibrionales bacterium]|nr:polyprenyl synthetase family protein [Thermodesulfovibrionales bacterium]